MNNGRWRLGGDGNDHIDLGWQEPWDVRDNADGGDGDDTLLGNIANNHMRGGSGNDYLSGGWGNDHLEGGTGRDVMFGGDGDDWLEGGSNTDRLDGDGGNDTLEGGTGDDELNGGDGADFLDGGGNNDQLNGGSGNDRLFGGAGNDFASGGSGNDTIGESATLLADTGNDTMQGGDGNDTISSFSGQDRIFGDGGSDDITVFDPNRLLSTGVVVNGGAGVDTLHIEARDLSVWSIRSGFGSSALDGFERIDIEDSSTGTLEFSFRDVINLSDTDILTIDGDTRDTVFLQNNVARDLSSGGSWVMSIVQTTADPNESFARYEYNLGGEVLATVSIDTDISVNLI